MKFLGLKSIVVKKYNHSSSSKMDSTKDYPNLLEQNFSINRPNMRDWVNFSFEENNNFYPN